MKLYVCSAANARCLKKMEAAKAKTTRGFPFIMLKQETTTYDIQLQGAQCICINPHKSPLHIAVVFSSGLLFRRDEEEAASGCILISLRFFEDLVVGTYKNTTSTVYLYYYITTYSSDYVYQEHSSNVGTTVAEAVASLQRGCVCVCVSFRGCKLFLYDVDISVHPCATPFPQQHTHISSKTL